MASFTSATNCDPDFKLFCLHFVRVQAGVWVKIDCLCNDAREIAGKRKLQANRLLLCVVLPGLNFGWRRSLLRKKNHHNNVSPPSATTNLLSLPSLPRSSSNKPIHLTDRKSIHRCKILSFFKPVSTSLSLPANTMLYPRNNFGMDSTKVSTPATTTPTTAATKRMTMTSTLVVSSKTVGILDKQPFQHS